MFLGRDSVHGAFARRTPQTPMWGSGLRPNETFGADPPDLSGVQGGSFGTHALLGEGVVEHSCEKVNAWFGEQSGSV